MINGPRIIDFDRGGPSVRSSTRRRLDGTAASQRSAMQDDSLQHRLAQPNTCRITVVNGRAFDGLRREKAAEDLAYMGEMYFRSA